MTNQSFTSETTRKNIPWAEVAKIFHLEHLSQHRTVTPVAENKKPPEEVSDAELVASLNRKYNPAEIEEALITEEEEDAPDPELSQYYPAPYYVKHNCLGYVKRRKNCCRNWNSSGATTQERISQRNAACPSANGWNSGSSNKASASARPPWMGIGTASG